MTSRNKFKSKYKKIQERDIKDEGLEKRPPFLKNMVDYFQVGRLTGVDVKNNLFKEIVTYDAEVNLAGGAEASIIIAHNLGYKPLYWGSYRLIENTVDGADAYPIPFVGMVDQPKHSPYGTIYPFGQNGVFTQDVTNTRIELQTQFGCETGKVAVRLHILREKNV